MDSDLASDDDNEDSDDIDYFADIPSDGEGGPSVAGGRGTKRAHYEDFFDAPDDEEESNHPKVKQKATRQEEKLERAMEGKAEEEREEGERDNLDENESSDGGELSDLSEDIELEGEGEGSTGESGAEWEEEEEEEEGEEGRAGREEEDGEEENQQTLSSHEKKQQKVSYMYVLQLQCVMVYRSYSNTTYDPI